MHDAIQPLEPRRLLSSVIAMYTYAGDANLDGTIMADDYGIIDSAFGGGSAFASGDFNYDGLLDSRDLGEAALTLTDFSGTAKRDVIVVSPSAYAGGVDVSVNGKVNTTF